MAKPKLGVSFREGLIALVAAGLSAAAFPPLGLWPMSLVGASLLLWLVRGLETAPARNLGLLYGLGYGLGTMHWFFRIFGPVAVSHVAIFAAYFGLFAHLVASTRLRSPFVRALLTATFAVGVDWLRGDARYLRFPWYTLPHALAAEPRAVAPVRWLGTYGFTFVLWLIAAWGAFGRKWTWCCFALVPVCFWFTPDNPLPDRRALLMRSEEQPLESLFALASISTQPHSPNVLLQSSGGISAISRFGRSLIMTLINWE